MNGSLTKIEPSTQLSALVWRILGANPSPFTLQGTNTYLIGNGKKRILIDTGEEKISAYISELQKVLGDNEISSIICTHWHGDHVGGVDDVLKKVVHKDIPVYKLKEPGKHDPVYQYIEDGQVFQTEGATLRVFATPGHTMDHISLYLEEEGTVFSGDCILGEGTTIFEDLHLYMQSLQKILDRKPKRIYPGHGPVVEDPLKKITEYMSHRNARENQILDAIKNKGVASVTDIVGAVYATTRWSLMLGAMNNVNQHLTKLIKEDRIERTGEGYQIKKAALA
ncbi:unnamed protein product [Enterobius vermicularis]|uniref:Beta-lactamase-like protein 2 homolog n=1 Tax=Enterobius vermicularis TaxID=51028 RepID=A0A0N4UV25_ENTVE|nr:unnamed protein product [Enterobius vermicularis]